MEKMNVWSQWKILVLLKSLPAGTFGVRILFVLLFWNCVCSYITTLVNEIEVSQCRFKELS